MDNPKTAETFKSIKKELGDISEYALAKKLDISSSTVNRYSTGKTSISLERLHKFLSILGLDFKIQIIEKEKDL